MDKLENFIIKFGGLTEEYTFYNGEVTLRYDPKDHVYLLLKDDGILERVNGVTQTCGIIDKSRILIPWGCKMMAEKLLDSMSFYLGDSKYEIDHNTFIDLVNKSKKAHKEKIDEAGNVGTQAHNWIEEYIKGLISKNADQLNNLLASFPADERAKNACDAALDWMTAHNVRWIYTERKIYSRKHKYAGTMDGLCIVDSCTNPLCCPHPFKDRLSIADWKTSNYLHPEYIMQTASYEAAYEEETEANVEDRWIIRLGKDDAKFETWHIEAENFQEDFNTFLSALDLRRKFDALEDRLSDIKDVYRRKVKSQKAADLSKKCKAADRYKGIRKPACNGGNPCEYCLNKYMEVQSSKPKKVNKKFNKNVKPTSHEMIQILQAFIEST